MKTPFFDSLIDDFGIWQHSDGQQVLPEHGYALDDATRGLIVCLALKRPAQAKVLLSYVKQSLKGSDFYGLASSDRQFFDYPSSEDAKGQVVWALGYAISQQFEIETCRQILSAIVPGLDRMTSLRGPAYALLGTVYFDHSLAKQLYDHLSRQFSNLNEDWFWPEDRLTYANGIMPYALLRYAATANDQTAQQLGLKVLNFVESACNTYGRPEPIGYDGWFPRGGQPARNGQQNIDVTYMMMAWLAAYQLSRDSAYLEHARAWYRWFEGDNIAGARMYEPDSLKAYDGINLSKPAHHNAAGINYHAGAESNICFLLAKHLLAKPVNPV